MSDVKSPKLAVNQKLCIQCGTCVATYPDHFEFTDNNTKVQVKKDADFSNMNLAEVKNTCPSLAIEEEGGEAPKLDAPEE